MTGTCTPVSNLHVCTRICSNGDARRELRLTDNVERWYDYNSTMRFGQALIVDGVIRYKGYLTEDQLIKYQADAKNAWAFKPVDPMRETKETGPINCDGM